MEAMNISLLGTVTVKLPLSPMNCSDDVITTSLPISLEGNPFPISPRHNSLVVTGCNNSLWFRDEYSTKITKCTTLCDANSTVGVASCNLKIPPQLRRLEYSYKSNEPSNIGFCGYVFPVDYKWFATRNYIGKLLPYNMSSPYVPLVLEWEFGRLKGLTDDTCKYADDYCLTYPDSDKYGSRKFNDDSKYHSYDDCRRRNGERREYYYDGYTSYYGRECDNYVSSTKYCSCTHGYEGNPYLPEGCTDIDECSNSAWNWCLSEKTCINTPGSYECQYDESSKVSSKVGDRKALIYIGSALGALFLLVGAWKSSKAITKLILASRRYKYFKQNGGLLLEQQLSATENGIEKTKLFCSKELAKATDDYNENRVLGLGGQGTVYKGMLADGRIVAVKKSKRVKHGDLVVFINEVVILSQINHRNVVKLLGCCLESKVPLLVYEFIPNGTLFQHIHEPSEELPLTWKMRVRIAIEVAGALAYLHSASSAPIYHRDIKSTNILLDNKYRAKVADFGTSRLVSIDQTHLTTRVVGTFGYMDPEYFRSSQFTEKSDVYSFGVVMVELLTGEKAILAIRAETGRGLAAHFLYSMEENQLFKILDARVLEEGKTEEIVAMADLAGRCLNLNGRRRPTMREVAHDLEAIRVSKEGSDCLQNQYNSKGSNYIDVAESDDFSSISGR